MRVPARVWLVAASAVASSPVLAADPQLVAENAEASANDRVFSAFVALGGGMAPKYAGASRYEAIPFGIANLGWRGFELQVRGPEARVDVLPDSAWAFGPIVTYRGSRDDDVKGPVGRLEKVDSALDAGGFVGYRFGGGADGQGEVGLRFTALHGVAGEDVGFSANASVSYAALRWGRVYADVDADLSYGSRKFNRTYFGVTRTGSAASGLRAYRPGAGVSDVGVGATLGYQIDERWGVLGRASLTRYVGDAADSPIVKHGSKTGALLGLGVSYRY